MGFIFFFFHFVLIFVLFVNFLLPFFILEGGKTFEFILYFSFFIIFFS